MMPATVRWLRFRPLTTRLIQIENSGELEWFEGADAFGLLHILSSKQKATFHWHLPSNNLGGYVNFSSDHDLNVDGGEKVWRLAGLAGR